MKHQYSVEQAVMMIKALPRMYEGGGYRWISNVSTVAYVAATILTQSNTLGALSQPDALTQIARQASIGTNVLNMFIHGRNSMNAPWEELRAALKDLGVAWRLTPTEVRQKAKLDALQPTPAAPAPKAVAPTADPVVPVKPTTLVVTPDGAVQVAKPPTQAVAPSTMVAKPVKSASRNWRIDSETQDILVTTTTRFIYGTPEHRRKMADIALQLGTASTTSAK